MASLPTAAILLCAVLFSGLFYDVEVRAAKHAVDLTSTVRTEQAEFDYFMLALQWPATFCSTHENKCCPENGCCKGSRAPVGFTINGLWADYNDGSYPSCCKGAAFNYSEITPFLGALSLASPVLSCNPISSCDNKLMSFWVHQWEKHGTCTTSVTEDQFGYFLTSLTLYLKYNVTDVLTDAGITPSNTAKYSSASITSAIEDAFLAPPLLTCKNDLIKEVRLCFTKEFKPRACVGASDCPEYVTLPAFAFVGGTKTGASWLKSAIDAVA